jgi:hypothetical protein
LKHQINLQLEEHLKVINLIIDDQDIKEILFPSTNPLVIEEATNGCNLTAVDDTSKSACTLDVQEIEEVMSSVSQLIVTRK